MGGGSPSDEQGHEFSPIVGIFCFVLFYSDCYSSQETETLTEQFVQFSPLSSYTCATASKKDLFRKIKASLRTLGIICGSNVPIKRL